MAKGNCRSCLWFLGYAKLHVSQLQFQTIHFLIELSAKKWIISIPQKSQINCASTKGGNMQLKKTSHVM